MLVNVIKELAKFYNSMVSSLKYNNKICNNIMPKKIELKREIEKKNINVYVFCIIKLHRCCLLLGRVCGRDAIHIAN